MADYVTLTCPSCGAKLEVTEDIGQFACAHCGQEHILYQAGGIVALKPLVESIKKIEAAVDDVSLDIAINRLYFEIEELNDRKNKILDDNPKPNQADYSETIGSGLLSLILSVLSILYWHSVEFSIFFFVIGFLSTFGILFFYHHKKSEWDVTVGLYIKELDLHIASKRAELRQLKLDEE